MKTSHKISSLIAATLAAAVSSAHAASNTWSATPGSGLWATAANWSLGTVGYDDIYFGASSITTISTASRSDSSLTFNSGASAYTINGTDSSQVLRFDNTITDNSSSLQTFNVNLKRNTANFLTLGANNGSVLISGTFDYNAATTTVSTVAFGTTTGGVVTIAGNVINTTGTGAAGFTLSTSGAGSGTLILSGSNAALNGVMTIGNNTVLKLASAYALGVGASINATSAVGSVNTLWLAVDSAIGNLNLAIGQNNVATERIVADRATAGSAVDQTFLAANLGTQQNVTFSKGGNVTAGTPTVTLSGTTVFGATNNSQATIVNARDVNLSLGAVTSATATSAQTNILVLDGNSTGNTITGAIANNAGSYTNTTALGKAGTGTWTLSGTNTYTGITAISGGTLKLDFSAAGAPTSNILYNGVTPATVTIGCGNLLLTGSSGAANSQTLGTLSSLSSSNPGAGKVTLASGSGGTMALNITSLSSNTNALLDFILDANSTVNVSGATVNSFAGQRVTYGGNDFAYYNASKNIVAASGHYSNGNASIGASTSTNTGSYFLLSGSLSRTSGTDLAFRGLKVTGTGTNDLLDLGNGTMSFNNSTLLYTGGGNNSYTIKSGTMQAVNSSSELIVDVVGGAALTIDNTVALTNGTSGWITAVGKAGDGTLIVSGGKSYTDKTYIVGGTYSFDTIANGGSSSSLGASTNAAGNLFIGGVLKYTGGGGSTDRSFTIVGASATIDASGTGALTWAPASALVFSNRNNSASGNNFTQNNFVTFTGTSTADNTFGSALGLLVDTNSGGGASPGQLTVTKSGAGKWVLSGTNTYTGGTYINGGTLEVTGTETAGTSGPLGKSGNITFGGGTLQYCAGNTADYSSRIKNSTGAISIDTNGQTVTYASALDSSNIGGIAKSGSGLLIVTSTGANLGGFTGGVTVTSGTLEVGTANGTGAVSGNGVLVLNRSDALSLSSINAANGVYQIGGGTTTLGGTSSYTGPTTVNSGVLALGANAALGNTAVTVNGGCVFGAGSGASLAGSLTLAGNSVPANAGTLDLTSGGAFGTFTLSGAGTALTLGGTSSDAGAIVKVNVGAANMASQIVVTTGSVAVNAGAFTVTPTYVGGPSAGSAVILSAPNGISNYSAISSPVVYSQTPVLLNLAATGTAVTLSWDSTASASSTAYWHGGVVSGNGNVWFAQRGASNWATDATGSTGANVPGTSANVYLSATGGSNLTGMSLGVSATLNSLTFNGGSSASIVDNSNSLTLNASGTAIYVSNPGQTLALALAINGTGQTVIDNGTLQVGNGGTVGNLPSGAVLGAAGTLAFNRSDTITLSNSLSNGVGLTQAGAGTLIVNTALSNTGPTTINGGTLQIGASGTTGSLGTGAIVNNGVLAFNHTDSVTLSNSISGTGAISQLSTAGLTLSGSNSYTGRTNVGNGAIYLSSPNALPAGSTVAINNGALYFNTALNATIANPFVLTGNATIRGAVPGVNVTFTGGLDGSALGSGNTVVIAPTNLNTSTQSGNTFTIASGAYDFGSATVDFTNAGTTTLPPASVPSFNMTGGTLNAGSLDFTGHGNRAFLSGGIVNVSGNIIGQGDYFGELRFAGATVTANAIQGTGNSGSNLTSGTLAVNQIYDLNANTAAANAGVVGANGGWLVARRTEPLFAYVLPGVNGVTTSLLNAGPNGLNIDSAGYDIGIVAPISNFFGAGTLTKAGSGTLTLGFQSGYSGITTVNGGTFALDFNRFGSSATTSFSNLLPYYNTVVLNGGNFAITGHDDSTSSVVVTGTVSSSGWWVTLSGSNMLYGGMAVTGPGLNTYVQEAVDGARFLLGTSGSAGTSGTFTLTGQSGVTSGQQLSAISVLQSGTVAVNQGANNAFAYLYVTALTGSGNLFKAGDGELIIAGSSSYTGTLRIGAGQFLINNPNALPNAVLDMNGADTGNFVFNGIANASLGGLSGSRSLELVNRSGGAVALTVGLNNQSTIYSGVLSGSSTLTKKGSGMLALAGANTYTDATTISSGTLQIGSGGMTGSLSPSSAITDNGTLAFNRSNTITQGADLAATISGSGSVVQAGAGTTILSGSNKYTGGSTVSTGTLQIANIHALGTGGLTVNGGALDLHGNSVSVAAFSGSGGVITNMASGTSTLTTAVASGTSTYAGAIANGAGGVVLTNSGAGTLILSGSLTMSGLNANNGDTQLTQSGSIGAISISAAGNLELTANGVNSAKVLQTNSLSISAGGKLDLWDNALILRDQTGGSNQGANLSTVQGLVNTAFDNGNWDKPGISSSSVIADLGAYSVLTVMVYDNTVLGVDSFEGINNLTTDNGGNQVMLKVTYLGDFDGNGIVNSADYGWLDFYYGYGLTVGDLNCDGQVNSADYNGIDYGYGYQAYGVMAGGGIAVPGAATAAPASPEAVPEPGALAMLLVGATGLLGRRARRVTPHRE